MYDTPIPAPRQFLSTILTSSSSFRSKAVSPRQIRAVLSWVFRSHQWKRKSEWLGWELPWKKVGKVRKPQTPKDTFLHVAVWRDVSQIEPSQTTTDYSLACWQRVVILLTYSRSHNGRTSNKAWYIFFFLFLIRSKYLLYICKKLWTGELPCLCCWFVSLLVYVTSVSVFLTQGWVLHSGDLLTCVFCEKMICDPFSLPDICRNNLRNLKI